jgi:hypothetical protein
MAIKPINHELEAQRQLLSQYFTRDTPKLRAVLKSFTDEIQDLQEDVIYLEKMLFLDLAEGVFLDFAGELVVESRNGRDDDTYREAIRVKAAVNRFSGTVNDLLTLIRLSYDVPPQALYQNAAGTDADIVIDAPLSELRSSLTSFQRNLNRAKPAGKEIYVHFKVEEPGFLFDSETNGLDNGLLYGTISAGKIVGPGAFVPAPEPDPVITQWAMDFGTPTSSSIDIDFQVDSVGDIWYLATLASDPAPAAATIIATGATKSVPFADNPDIAAFTGLVYNTSYRFSAVFVRDSDSVQSAVASTVESTLPVLLRGLTGFTSANYGRVNGFFNAGAGDNDWVWGVVASVDTGAAALRTVSGNSSHYVQLGSSGGDALARVTGGVQTNLTKSGAYASSTFEHFTALAAHWKRAVDRSLYVENLTKQTTASTNTTTHATGDIFVGNEGTARAFTNGVIYSIWRAKNEEWTQAKQDAWFAALQADPEANLYPAEATEAWTFTGVPNLSSPVAPVKGTGNNMTFNGTGLSLVDRSVEWR